MINLKDMTLGEAEAYHAGAVEAVRRLIPTLRISVECFEILFEAQPNDSVRLAMNSVRDLVKAMEESA